MCYSVKYKLYKTFYPHMLSLSLSFALKPFKTNIYIRDYIVSS